MRKPLASSACCPGHRAPERPPSQAPDLLPRVGTPRVARKFLPAPRLRAALTPSPTLTPQIVVCPLPSGANRKQRCPRGRREGGTPRGPVASAGSARRVEPTTAMPGPRHRATFPLHGARPPQSLPCGRPVPSLNRDERNKMMRQLASSFPSAAAPKRRSATASLLRRPARGAVRKATRSRTAGSEVFSKRRTLRASLSVSPMARRRKLRAVMGVGAKGDRPGAHRRPMPGVG
jgi:hypothetical protein